MFTIASLECNLLNMFMKLVSLSDTLIHNRRAIKSHKVIDKEDIDENLKRKKLKKNSREWIGRKTEINEIKKKGKKEKRMIIPGRVADSNERRKRSNGKTDWQRLK